MYTEERTDFRALGVAALLYMYMYHEQTDANMRMWMRMRMCGFLTLPHSETSAADVAL